MPVAGRPPRRRFRWLDAGRRRLVQLQHHRRLRRPERGPPLAQRALPVWRLLQWRGPIGLARHAQRYRRRGDRHQSADDEPRLVWRRRPGPALRRHDLRGRLPRSRESL